jgi:hypothetical protein
MMVGSRVERKGQMWVVQMAWRMAVRMVVWKAVWWAVERVGLLDCL